MVRRTLSEPKAAEPVRTASSVNGGRGWLLAAALPLAAAGMAASASGEIPASPLIEVVPAATAPSPAPRGPAPAATAQDRVSPWLAELIKLADRGMDDSVLLPFVANTEGTFNLTPDQIIRLSARGVSSAVINAMLVHDKEIVAGVRELRATTVPASVPLLPWRLSSPPPVASISTPEPGGPGETASIIVREPLPESPSISGPAFESAAQAPPPASPANEPIQSHRAAAGGIYRVRAPHPVQLTDTLVVYRCEPRTPNVVIVSTPQ